MTLGNLQLGFVLLLPVAALLGCDAKDGSVSGTATTSGEPGDTSEPSGGSTSGSGPFGTSADPGDDTEDGSSSGDIYGQCEQESTVIAVDEQSPLGLSAQDLLDDAVGSYTGALQWVQEGPVQYTGDVGPTSVDAEIVYAGGEARSVAGILVTGCMHDGPCPCPDLLEVDVQLNITTADGVLDESFDAQLVYTEDDSGFASPRVSLRIEFDPDETTGSFSLASLDIDDQWTLQYLEFGFEPQSGTLGGALNAAVEGIGFGFGTIASIGLVQSLDNCAAYYAGGTACSLSGCSESSGRPVWGNADSCDCGEVQSYCFAGPLEGEPTPTRYTRSVNDGYEEFDEVVEFDVTTDLGGEWRACSAAPDVGVCSCEDACGGS